MLTVLYCVLAGLRWRPWLSLRSGADSAGARELLRLRGLGPGERRAAAALVRGDAEAGDLARSQDPRSTWIVQKNLRASVRASL